MLRPGSCCGQNVESILNDSNLDTFDASADQEETVWETYKSRQLESFTTASIAVMVNN